MHRKDATEQPSANRIIGELISRADGKLIAVIVEDVIRIQKEAVA